MNISTATHHAGIKKKKLRKKSKMKHMVKYKLYQMKTWPMGA